MRRIPVIMQKGGVGKTETALNLGDALADEGHRVLIVDWDPQGSLSMGLKLPSPRISAYQAIFTNPTGFDALDLLVTSEHNRGLAGSVAYIPRTPESLDLEARLLSTTGRELKLVELLDRIEEQYPGYFTHALIDSPPNLGPSTDSALMTAAGKQNDDASAGHGLLIPMMAETFAIEALPLLLRQITVISKVFRVTLPILGIVVSRYNEARGNAVISNYEYLCGLEGLPVLCTVRERTKILEEAKRAGTTGYLHMRDSDLRSWYRELAKVIA
jgi:chromosome partitioning protein